MDNLIIEKRTAIANHQGSMIGLICSPYHVARFLLIISLLLLVGNLVSIYLVNSGKINLSLLNWYTAWYFDFNGEANFPAYFSTIILLFAALLNFLLFLHNRIEKSTDFKYWLVLAIIFTFLSIDENVQFHEHIAQHLTPALPTDLNGFLIWSWVVPYSVFVLAVVIYFLKFILSLPLKTKNLIILSGALFVFGALGLEFFEGYFYKLYGLDHIINKTLYCIEELFEMWGIILFIYALLDYIVLRGVRMTFANNAE